MSFTSALYRISLGDIYNRLLHVITEQPNDLATRPDALPSTQSITQFAHAACTCAKKRPFP